MTPGLFLFLFISLVLIGIAWTCVCWADYKMKRAQNAQLEQMMKQLVNKSIDFEEAAKRVENHLHSGIRKTKGNII